jgi:hypothetical protein
MPWNGHIFGDRIDISRTERMFHVSSYFTVSDSVDTLFQFNTNASQPVVIHYRLNTATQACRFTVVEAPTVTDGNVAVPALALNRNSEYTPVMQLFSNPTAISGGTTLIDELIPSGGNKTGGSVDGGVVWTMKPNTKYVATIENLGNNPTIATFEMAWLELPISS